MLSKRVFLMVVEGKEEEKKNKAKENQSNIQY
jgi:hypothetical protein